MAQAFYPTAESLIDTALVDLGAIDPEGGVAPTSSQYTYALRTLNLLVTSWQSLGMQVWCQKMTTKTLTLSDGTYTVGPGGDINVARPMGITQVYLRNTTSDYDHPLTLISREEYLNLSNKSTEGTPTLYYYEPAYDLPGSNSGASAKGNLYLWPEPDATTVANYVLHLRYTRPIQDFSATSDSLDFPQEWFNAVRWNLAHQLCPQYEVPLGKMREIERLAKDTLDLALSNDADPASLYISPAQQ
jgi:hypothetical protein